MEVIIYVGLLGEGIEVYRPVPAIKVGENIYKINGYEIHEPSVETWEFLPGTLVVAEEKFRGEKMVLAAMKEFNEAS